jgi:hypothetical protein
MLEQSRDMRPDKPRNPVEYRRGQGRRRKHHAQRILLQHPRLFSDPEGDERPVRLVRTFHIAPGRLPQPQHSPFAQPETHPHIAPEDGGRGKAEVIIRGQHLCMRAKGVGGPIGPGDIREFEILLRAGPDDELQSP